MADELETGLELEAHEGSNSDLPFVIATGAFGTLDAEQVHAIRAAYAAGRPIVLVQASLDYVLALQRLLGNRSFRYEFPDGVTVAELYATDLEPDGSVWQWAQFPPASVTTAHSRTILVNFEDGTTETSETPEEMVLSGEDLDAHQQVRADAFVDWLRQDGERMNTPLARSSRLQTAQTADNNLTDLGAAFVDQGNFQQDGNHYQLSHFIYRCHSIDTNLDWFYVQQFGVFNGLNAYKTNEAMNKGWYLGQIETNMWMDRYTNNPDAVGLIQSSPQTANNEAQVTSGVTWEIGGEVSVDKNGPSGTVTAGVSISNSTTVTVRDCEVRNVSNDRGNNAHWLYVFKLVDIGSPTDCLLQNCLTEVPHLAISSFQPMNQWIWKTSPEVRAADASMGVVCYVWLVRSQEHWYFAYATLTHDFKATNWSRRIHVPYPPTQ